MTRAPWTLESVVQVRQIYSYRNGINWHDMQPLNDRPTTALDPFLHMKVRGVIYAKMALERLTRHLLCRKDMSCVSYSTVTGVDSRGEYGQVHVCLEDTIW